MVVAVVDYNGDIKQKFRVSYYRWMTAVSMLVGDAMTNPGAFVSVGLSTTVVAVVYCLSEDEWVRSRLMSLLRRSSSSMSDVVRLSLIKIDADARQFTDESFGRSLAECHLAVVVVSTDLVDAIALRGRPISGGADSGGFLGGDSTAARRRVYVSATDRGDVAGGHVDAARLAFATQREERSFH